MVITDILSAGAGAQHRSKGGALLKSYRAFPGATVSELMFLARFLLR